MLFTLIAVNKCNDYINDKWFAPFESNGLDDRILHNNKH